MIYDGGIKLQVDNSVVSVHRQLLQTEAVPVREKAFRHCSVLFVNDRDLRRIRRCRRDRGREWRGRHVPGCYGARSR